MAMAMGIPALGHGPTPPDGDLRRMQDEFLTGLTHTIRTPISGILGMTDLLLETQLDQQQSEYVAAARMCAEELLEHLNCALRFSELAAGASALEESDFNLVETIESAAAPYVEKARAKGLRFSLVLEETLPQAVFGDAVRLREIISHLLGNAVKFTAAGEVELRAGAGMVLGGRFRLALSIRDTGIGIESGQSEAVFESFRQGEAALARNYPGLGLGLALVRKLVHAMRGEVGLESEPGKGTVVAVSLPLRTSVELAAVQPKPASSAGRILERVLGRRDPTGCRTEVGQASER
jgi:two-component system, sensor histidine kinase and response regulator